MRRRLVPLAGGTAVVLVAAVVGSAHARPDTGGAAADPITLAVQPTVTSWGKPIAVAGTLVHGRPGQHVTVQFKQCGAFPREFRDAAETTTEESGAWSVGWLFGRGAGSYRAVSGDLASAERHVQGRPAVLLRRQVDNTWDVWATAALPFYKKRVLLQRLNQRVGGWVTMRSIELTEQLANSPQFGLPSVSSGKKDIRLRVPRGTTVRAVLPLGQARPCYVAGYSNILRA